MAFQFTHHLTLTVCIAVQVMRLGGLVCPCQQGNGSGDTEVVPAKTDGDRNTDCCFCHAKSEAKTSHRTMLLEREVRPLAILADRLAVLEDETLTQYAVVLALTALPSLDRAELQVFLE